MRELRGPMLAKFDRRAERFWENIDADDDPQTQRITDEEIYGTPLEKPPHGSRQPVRMDP